MYPFIPSLGVVSLFTRVPTVVQDKLTADPLLEECTCIQIDNLIEMLTFCEETTNFRRGLIYTDNKKDWLWDLCCC